MRIQNNQGFSLLELVITIAVVGIMMAMVPVARGMLPEIQVNKAARTLAQDIREARSMAVKYQEDIIVVFDINAGSISMYEDSDKDGYELAELLNRRTISSYGGGATFCTVTTTGVDGQQITNVVKMGGTNPPAITFHPNGTAVNVGTAYLCSENGSGSNFGRAIEILATGKVQTWNFNVNGSPGPWMKMI